MLHNSFYLSDSKILPLREMANDRIRIPARADACPAPVWAVVSALLVRALEPYIHALLAGIESAW